MLRISRIVRNGLSLVRPVNAYIIRKHLSNQAENVSSAVQTPPSQLKPNPADVKITELISKNIEAESFILERFNLLGSNLKIDNLKWRVEQQIKTKDPKKIVTNDLKLLAHISETQNDIDLLIQGIKLYLKDEENLRVFRFGPLLMKLLGVLEMTEKAYEIFQDKELEPVFRGPASANFLMRKYLQQKNYARILEIFEMQKERYTLENLNLRPDLSTKFNKKAQAVPVEHMQTVALALLYMNQLESCVKGIELIKFAHEKKSTISNLTSSRLFLLAINHNNFELANLAVSEIKLTDKSSTLKLNLTAILKAKQNELDEAFKTIDSIFLLPKDEKLKNNGFLFSDVIKALVECIKRQSASENGVDKTKINSYKAKLKSVMEKLKAEKRLFRQELYKFSTEQQV